MAPLKPIVEDKDTEPSYSDIYRLDEVFHGWMDRKDSLKMTSQDIQALLKELPFDEGQEPGSRYCATPL